MSGGGERFFRREPSEVCKNLRLRLIDINTDGGAVEEKIAFYCTALHVTRRGFYWYLSYQNAPWKYDIVNITFRKAIETATLR